MKFSKVITIKDGKATKFANEVANFISKTSNGEYEVTIQELEMAKTNDQNKYFNGVQVELLSKKTGYTPKDCKHWFKKEFGEKWLATNPITGTKEMELKSQGEYSSEEMSNLIERCDIFLRHDLGLNFPSCEEWKEIDKEKKAEWKKTFNSNL